MTTTALPGQMGGKRVTVKHLKVVKVDEENNLIYLSGAVPGANNSYLALRRLKLSLHAIVLTLSPVVAIGWSLFLFGTSPTLQQAMGGIAVLAGVLIVTLRQNRAVVVQNN